MIQDVAPRNPADTNDAEISRNYLFRELDT